MLINFTNHPSDRWSREQREAALAYGEILDLPFPSVPEDWDEGRVAALAESWAARIAGLNPAAVVCQGEFTLTAAVVSLLLARGIPALAACSRRCVLEERQRDGTTVKRAVFRFARFRPYVLPRGGGDGGPA